MDTTTVLTELCSTILAMTLLSLFHHHEEVIKHDDGRLMVTTIVLTELCSINLAITPPPLPIIMMRSSNIMTSD